MYQVLIAEDSAEVAERLRAALSEIPEVEIVGVADNGRDALRLHAAAGPHCAVVDLQMPLVNGFEVIRGIRERDSSCRIIVLTNLEEPECRARCLDLGADYFLRKSRDFERVAELVGRWVREPNSA